MKRGHRINTFRLIITIIDRILSVLKPLRNLFGRKRERLSSSMQTKVKDTTSGAGTWQAVSVEDTDKATDQFTKAGLPDADETESNKPPPEAPEPITSNVVVEEEGEPENNEPQQINVPTDKQQTDQPVSTQTEEPQTETVERPTRKPSMRKKRQIERKRSFEQSEYRPPVLTPPSELPSAAPTPQPLEERGDTPLPEQPSTRSLPIEVRVLLERGGFCSVSLLPRRLPSLPEELSISTKSGSLQLKAMQDEWYQDVYIAEIGTLLRGGAVWYEGDEGVGLRWVLSGREVYVLSDRPDLRGFVSQPRLMLGHNHVVLCSENRLVEVKEVIHEAGAEVNEIADVSRGMPSRWLALLGIKPTKAILPGDEVDILNILRPLPEIEISLEVGIRLEYSTWLEGYPPLIRVYGGSEHISEVVIDGQVASHDEDDAYRAPGCDSIGLHQVWCSGVNKSYSIEKREPDWSSWDAHSSDIPSIAKRRVAICGPLVRQCESVEGTMSFLLPGTNPIAVGSTPGEFLIGARCSDILFAPFVITPWFEPVWALPMDPFRCKRDTMQIVLMGEPRDVQRLKKVRQLNYREGSAVLSWCRAILNASRKGLRKEPDTDEVRQLWDSYKKTARYLKRALK